MLSVTACKCPQNTLLSSMYLGNEFQTDSVGEWSLLEGTTAVFQLHVSQHYMTQLHRPLAKLAYTQTLLHGRYVAAHHQLLLGCCYNRLTK